MGNETPCDRCLARAEAMEDENASMAIPVYGAFGVLGFVMGVVFAPDVLRFLVWLGVA